MRENAARLSAAPQGVQPPLAHKLSRLFGSEGATQGNDEKDVDV